MFVLPERHDCLAFLIGKGMIKLSVETFFKTLSFALMFMSISSLLANQVDISIALTLMSIWSEIIAWKQR